MKKICILSAVNIKHMSMISVYTERMKRDQIEFDIIYMDKYGETEEFEAKNKYVFKNIIKQSDNKLYKIYQYFKFRKYAIEIIKKNNYDFIIVWNDIAIFMFADYLAKNYKKKYCLNIRDYLGEKNSIVFNRFKNVIENSAFSTISSEGFKNFLPSYNYLMLHSYNEEVLKKVEPKKELAVKKPIEITFIGNVRFFDINKQLLDTFKNDKRFKLNFYGTNAAQLKEYALKNEISNTDFHDSFEISKTSKFIKKTDLVNNIYGNNNMALDYAISIKLYYGIYNRTPILVVPKTYMAYIIKKYNIGFIIEEVDSTLPNKLYKWYNNIDYNEFNKNCENLIKDINKSILEFEETYQLHINKKD